VIAALFRKDRGQCQAETLYAATAGQARAPEFFTCAGARDTAEGRFDVLALHMFLAIDRLKKDGPVTNRQIRLLQEVFFQSLEYALREMGVGDLSVGRKIRGLAEAFYGRVAAYERALAADRSEFEAALARNILACEDRRRAAGLANYVAAARAALAAVPAEQLPGKFSDLAGALTALNEDAA
jgi:cytochrome b pre-mRNA-processing protein 3